MTSHQGLVAAETKRNVFKGSTVPQSVGYLNEKNIFFFRGCCSYIFVDCWNSLTFVNDVLPVCLWILCPVGEKYVFFFFIFLLLLFAWLNNAPQAVANYDSKSVQFCAFHLGDYGYFTLNIGRAVYNKAGVRGRCKMTPLIQRNLNVKTLLCNIVVYNKSKNILKDGRDELVLNLYILVFELVIFVCLSHRDTSERDLLCFNRQYEKCK